MTLEVKRITAALYAAVFTLSLATSAALTLITNKAYAAGPFAVIDTLQTYDAGHTYADNIGYMSTSRRIAQAFETGNKAGTVQEFVMQDYYTNSTHDGFVIKIYGSTGEGTIDEDSTIATFESESTSITDPTYSTSPESFRVFAPTSDDYELAANTRYWIVATISDGEAEAVWRQSNATNNTGDGSIPDATPSRAIWISGQNDGDYLYNSAGASYHATYASPSYHFNFRLTAVESEAPNYVPTVTTNNATSVTQTSATLNGSITTHWTNDGALLIERGFEYGLTNEYGTDVSETHNGGGYPDGSYSRAVTNLQCGTTYHFRAFAITAEYDSDNEFTGHGSDNTFTTQACTEEEDDEDENEEPAPDADNDGVLDSTEDNAPNNGDGNGDGIADSEQPNVTSFVNSITGKYSTLAVDDDCTVDAASGIAGSTSNADGNFQYPLGLLNFTLECGTPGATITVEAYHFDTNESNLVLRKYNSVSKKYWTIQDAVIEKLNIGGVPTIKAVYKITDGGDLDLDGEANGTIVDPVGLARSSVGAPNTGLSKKD